MGRIRIDEEKLKKLHNMNEFMDEKYGKIGTPRREALHEEAMRWYYGELLKDRRQSLKMTQQQLAERVGQERSYIARIEEGESDVRLSGLLSIAKALGLTLSFSPTTEPATAMSCDV